MPKKKQTRQNLTLVEWCDQQAAEGKKLKLVWDGGNDSGWVHFEIDDVETSNEYTKILEDRCYDELDYGSWAGDFEAQGEAYYDSEQKAFIGEDSYSENDADETPIDGQITIDKKLWFDVLNLRITNSGQDANVELAIKNGFKTEQHKATEEKIADYFYAELTDVASKIEDCQDVWLERSINRSEFKEEGDVLKFTVEEVRTLVQRTSDREIIITVKD